MQVSVACFCFLVKKVFLAARPYSHGWRQRLRVALCRSQVSIGTGHHTYVSGQPYSRFRVSPMWRPHTYTRSL